MKFHRKPILHDQSQRLVRKSCKPDRAARIRPAPRLNPLFRLVRAGPRFKTN